MSNKKTFGNRGILLDKCDSSIGISIGLRDKTNKIISGIFDPIIFKGSTIPCTKSKIYYTLYDNQKATEIKIYKGNSKYVDDNLLLWKFILKDIPKSLAGRQKIQLTLSYNENGILNISSRVYSTNKIYSKEIDTLKIDGDILSFEKNIKYDDWEKYRLAYLVKAVVKYGEEKVKDLNYLEAQKINLVLREIKRYLLLNNEAMVMKHKKELIYLLSQAS